MESPCAGVYAYPPDTGVLYDCPPPPEGAVELDAQMYHMSPWFNGPQTYDGLYIAGDLSTGASDERMTTLYGDFARANPGVFTASLSLWFPGAYPPTFQGEYPYGGGTFGADVAYHLYLYGYWPDESAGWLTAGPGLAAVQGGYSSMCISRFRKRRVTGAITLYTGTEGYVQIPDTTFYLRFDFFDDTCWDDINNGDMSDTRANTIYYPIWYLFGITEEKAWSPGYWERRERESRE